ncbi:hypothetical protein KP509_1Z073700 [Ceratopteris richardii]|nr:hypothetical protein KP509_1Z073700 [Ceratopteris richardii]
MESYFPLIIRYAVRKILFFIAFYFTINFDQHIAAGGFQLQEGGRRASEYEGRITIYVVITCIIAASGGLMFGYDIGISGGVTSMDSFLAKFFPKVLENKQRVQANAMGDAYCQYNDESLQLFTSSLYLAALISTFFASPVTRKYGRKTTLLIAGIFFDIGVVLNAAAGNLNTLIFGRIFLGFGVGFANQGVPLFLSEVAPTHLRGALNILFQLNVTIGILFANLVNYGTLRIEPWGWRLSLGIAGLPAVALTIGSLVLVETPNSLVERGQFQRAKHVLKKIRGTENVQAEFEDLVEASRVAQEVKHQFKNLMQRQNRPQLVIASALQFFQQFTGINAIMFYSPVLFQTLGFKNDASLYSAVITGAVNVLSTLVSVYSVDKLGRRFLLLEGSAQMFVSQVAVAVLLGFGIKNEKTELSHGAAIVIVLMVCVFVSAFAWSWGPLGWLIPSEIFPLETRSSGQSVTVSINMLFTFVIAQAFLSMLCTFKFGIFLFFAAWVSVMGVFTFLFIPETKNIPIEEMGVVWREHWFWKRIVSSSDDEFGQLDSKTPDI